MDQNTTHNKSYNFNTSRFLSGFTQLGTNLSILLNERIIPHKKEGGFIAVKLLELIHLQNSRKYQQLEWSFTLLQILHDELKIISAFDQNLLKKFQNLYKAYSIPKRSQNKTLYEHARIIENKYFGFRSEVHTASQLIKNKIKFIKQESPDYIVYQNMEKMFIECSSMHLHPNTEYSFILEKIQEKLTDKRTKEMSYANEKTALIVDITNIMSYSERKRKLPKIEDLVQQAIYSMDGYSLGGIVLYFYLLDKERRMISPIYIHAKNRRRSSNLIALLDLVFPEGKDEVTNYQIPYSS